MKRCLLFILLFCGISSLAYTEENKIIIMFYSRYMPIYDIATKSFEKQLKKNRFPAKTHKIILNDRRSPEEEFQTIRSYSPDMILAIGSYASALSNKSLTEFPRTHCMILDPMSTGISSNAASLDLDPRTILSFIDDYLPSTKKLGILYTEDRYVDFIKDISKAEKDFSPELHLVKIESAADIEKGIEELSIWGVDSLLLIPDPEIYSLKNISQVILTTIQRRIAVISLLPAFVKAGSLIGIYADIENNGALAADMTHEILTKKKKNIPVRYTSSYNISVNLIIGKRLGINILPKTIKKAKEVIR